MGKLRPMFDFKAKDISKHEVNRTQGILAAHVYLTRHKQERSFRSTVIAVVVGILMIGALAVLRT